MMTSDVTFTEIRANFRNAVDRTAYRGERFVIRKRGRAVAVLMPIDDLELLKLLEDQMDVQEAKVVLAEMNAKENRLVSWDRAKSELGL